MQLTTALNRIDKSIFYIFVVTMALGVFFYLPIPFFENDALKSMIFGFGVLVSCLLALFSSLLSGTLSFSKKIFSFSGAVFFLLILASSFFVKGAGDELFGVYGEVYTLSMWFTAVLASIIVSRYFSKENRVYFVFLPIILGFFFGLISLLVRGFAGGFADNLFGASFSLIGSIRTFGLFSVLTAILSMSVIELSPKNKVIKISSIVALVLSLISIVLINVFFLWFTLAVSSILLFIFLRTQKVGSPQKKTPVLSLSISFFAIVMIAFGSLYGGSLRGLVDSEEVFVSPRLGVSSVVVGQTILNNPFGGAGAGNYADAWYLYRPSDSINQTSFWNTGFNGGVGTWDTFFVMHGIFGILAFFVFFGTAVFISYLAIFKEKTGANYFGAVSAILLVALLTSSLMFVFSFSLIILMFILFGAVFGFLVNSGIVERESFSFIRDSRNSFFVIILIIFSAVVVSWSLVIISSKFINTVSYQKMIKADSLGNFDKGNVEAFKILSRDANDAYARYIALRYLSLFKLEIEGNGNPEKLEGYFKSAEEAGVIAVRADGKNLQNWISLASVYDFGARVGVSGSLDSAVTAFEKAEELFPKSPSISFSKASLYYFTGNYKMAENYSLEALKFRPGFEDARLLYEASTEKSKTAGQQSVISDVTE